MLDHGNKVEVYFTIIPHQTGFTDQLNQFSAFFRLGHYLGYRYYHTDFSSPRSTFSAYNFQPTLISKIHFYLQIFIRIIMFRLLGYRSNDIFNLLGINSYLKQDNTEINSDNIEEIRIRFNSDNEEIKKLKTFSQIADYIRNKVNKSENREKIVIFQIEKGRSFVSTIISAIPPNNYQYRLRDEYLRLRKKNNWKSKFDDSKFKILVHIRLGDTSIIKTPWNTFISSWSIYKKVFTQAYERDEIISSKHIELNDYRFLLDKIDSEFEHSAMQSIIFSDGYERAFQKIIKFRESYKLSQKQVELLMQSRKKYKNEFFRFFDNLSNSEIVYGEELSKLLELIHAIFDSDLIITGTTQGMIINFVSNYFCKSTMPVVAVLYRGEKPDYPFFNGKKLDEKFVFIDVENPDYSEVLKIIHLKISGSLQ